MAKVEIVVAAIGGFAGVALGAAGAHLTDGDAVAGGFIATASQYLLLHSAALLGVAALSVSRPGPYLLRGVAVLFAIGMVLFGGGLSLYALTGSPIGRLGTPFGGTALLAGWLLLGVYGLSTRGKS
jgi:uncharacterized membrane protein YgdD (TMEM256/DUF423 family)